MTLKATLGAAAAVAAMIALSGAAFAGSSNGYTRTYGKDKVEIYISVKSGAYADVDYQTKKQQRVEIRSLESVPYPSQKPKIKEETAKAWGEVKKVKIEAEGKTSGTWDANYSSSASTHSKTQSSGGGGGGGTPTASSSPGNGNGGCGCGSSSTTSASASGGTSGSWSTGN